MKTEGTSTASGTSMSGTLTTTSFDPWAKPILINVEERGETLELISKQISMLSGGYPPPPQAERVFKIIYSCKDGKWNKSAPIYGTIIPAGEERYEFD